MKIFDYDDVLLLPKKCIVKSRSECNTEVKFGKHKFKMPVILANMKSIINEKLAITLAEKGYFYIMHRFNFDSFSFVVEMKKKKLISSISVGIKDADYDIIDRFANEKIYPDYITIDIAHGHSIYLRKMLIYIKEKLGNNSFIIAGNVATTQAIVDLEEWGADAIKVGVGPGKVCITKIKTGFGTGGWQLSAVNLCSKTATVPIIADGGLRTNGDICKSIRFGATMIMIGSLFAGHKESPGAMSVVDGTAYKEFYGSASEFNKGEKRYIEGKKVMIKLRGSIFDTLNVMKQDLQSSISYAGCKNLAKIRKTNYVLLKNNEGY